MKTRFNSKLSASILLLLCIVTSCSTQWYTVADTSEVKTQDLGNFPYHPLVYHLDLTNLIYQSYGQSLAWPFDPYYEESDNGKGNRARFMQKIHAWAAIKGAEQVKMGTGLDGFRGPGVLNGFEDNPTHDPIIYRYGQIYPWSSDITNTNGSWTEYLVPKEITSRIKDVYVCYRKVGQPADSIAIEKLKTKPIPQDLDANDVLLVFEGGTGDKGIQGQPPSQSLMGLVLMRNYPDGTGFDVHIAFRGSRSGSGGRALLQALNENNPKGNPDWITDMGYDLIGPENGGGHITEIGAVSRGMATCMASITPNLMECLKTVSKITNNGIPKRIFVTGHSLGAGLGEIFVSSILLGNKYGPEGNGNDMPDELRQWPWKQLKLITFSAPRVGDATWAEKLTKEGLSSEFFSTAINPYDKNALKPADPKIISLLIDPKRPSGFRVLIPTDPVTTEKIAGGKHVGKTVYVSKPSFPDAFKPPNPKAHQPPEIRRLLFTGLNDPRIPGTSWETWKITDITPDYKRSNKGTPEEYLKLAASIQKYYRNRDLYYDYSGFQSDFNVFMKLYDLDSKGLK
ncbi:MAG: hypothetical protein MUO53_07065 [Maribacter sp.]|nr:hypothetical protein [Maribacter sp.]